MEKNKSSWWEKIILKIEEIVEGIFGKDSNSRSIKFSEGINYGIKLVSNVFIYYLLIVAIYFVGLFLFVLGASSGDDFIFFIFGIPAVIIWFVTGLGIIALHIGMIYKVQIDVRNASSNFVYTETQEQYVKIQKEIETAEQETRELIKRENEERLLANELKQNGRRKHQTIGQYIDIKNEMQTQNDIIVKCERCSSEIKIPRPGAFRCTACKHVARVNEKGDITPYGMKNKKEKDNSTKKSEIKKKDKE